MPGARTLKDRRSVVRSFKERVQGRMKVSVAEIGMLEDPRRATIGVAVVSNSHTVCDQMLSTVVSMASTLPDAILSDRASEIFSFGEGGSGVRGGIEQMLGELGGSDEDEDEGEDT